MAATKLVEPYVNVRERIREYPVLLDIDGTSNVGGVIIAPTGPRLAYISGPKEFLETYTVDGSIPRNADRTFLNAYYLSFSAGLVIARSMNTTAVDGLYFDVKTSNEYKLLINTESLSFWGIELGGRYYFCNDGDPSMDNFIVTVKETVWGEDEYELVPTEVVDPETGDTVEKLEKVYTHKAKDLRYGQDLINKLKEHNRNKTYDACDNLSDLANILSTRYANDGIEVFYSERIGALVCSDDPNWDITSSEESLVGMAIESQPSSEPTIGLSGHKIRFKNGVALTEKDVLKITFTDTEKGVKSNWAFIYGTMAYYHGAIDKSLYEDFSLKQCKSLEDVATSICGISGMTAHQGDGFTKVDQFGNPDPNGTAEDKNSIYVQYSKGNRLLIAEQDTGLNVNCTVEQIDDDELIEQASEYEEFDKKLFALYPDDPQDSDKYKMIIQPDEENKFLMTLSDGDTTESYTVSLISDELDQSGTNCFIENLNTLQIGYNFITNGEFQYGNYDEGDASIMAVTPKSTQVFAFGDSGLDLSASKSIQCMINALYDLEDQELYDIEYLAPFGIVDLQFIKNYVMIGKNNDWFTPVDIPWDKTNANSIKGYFLNVDDTSNAIGMGPFDKNYGLTGWHFYLACSTLYYTKIMNNKAAMCEFAPVFDITNGILNFTNPVYMLGKQDRVKLLNFRSPVNFLIFNQRNNVYYLNDNWTLQPQRNIVSEEQNRRMVNKIKKDCKRLMQRFKGRTNTVTTRQDVETLLKYYMNSEVMSQIYKPNDYQVICNESNNPVEVITANKLGVTVRVRLENAIKYIDVLVDVFPLGVDFEA
jgi:hypothetical protein